MSSWILYLVSWHIVLSAKEKLGAHDRNLGQAEVPRRRRIERERSISPSLPSNNEVDSEHYGLVSFTSDHSLFRPSLVGQGWAPQPSPSSDSLPSEAYFAEDELEERKFNLFDPWQQQVGERTRFYVPNDELDSDSDDSERFFEDIENRKRCATKRFGLSALVMLVLSSLAARGGYLPEQLTTLSTIKLRYDIEVHDQAPSKGTG